MKINEKLLFFVLGILVLILVDLILWQQHVIGRENLSDIAVEFQGLVFDVILFGIIFTLYEGYFEKRKDIKRYVEEIEDYQGWKDQEASYRISGNIRRLNRLKINNLNLLNATLENASLANVDLEASDLANINLKGADLRNANLSNTNIQNGELINANLVNAKLNKANLFQANLEGANLSNANLQNSNLKSTSFVNAKMQNCDLRGARLWEINIPTKSHLESADLSWAKLFYNQREELEKLGVAELMLNRIQWFERGDWSESVNN